MLRIGRAQALGQVGPARTIVSQRCTHSHGLIVTNIDPRQTPRGSVGPGCSTVQLACKSLHIRTRISTRRGYKSAGSRACTTIMVRPCIRNPTHSAWSILHAQQTRMSQVLMLLAVDAERIGNPSLVPHRSKLKIADHGMNTANHHPDNSE
jgi:hypothetical protein